MQWAGQADRLSALQKTPQPAMDAGFFVVARLLCVSAFLRFGGDSLLDG